MALDEREEVREHLEDVDEGEGTDMDERRTQVSAVLAFRPGNSTLPRTNLTCANSSILPLETAILEPVLPPPIRTSTHRSPVSIGLAERDRYLAANRHVHALWKPVRVSGRTLAAHHVPGTSSSESIYNAICLAELARRLSKQSVLSAQFETATEFGSLLRANTPVSRMMTTYTRRGPGQSYLKSVLAERINSLIEHKDLNLEINPLKVCSLSFPCIL